MGWSVHSTCDHAHVQTHVQTYIPYKQNMFACGDLPVHMYGHAHVEM